MSAIYFNPWLWLGMVLLILAVSNFLLHLGLFVSHNRATANTSTFLTVMAVLGILFAAVAIFFFLDIPTGSNGIACVASPIFDLGGQRSQSVMYWRSTDCSQASLNRDIFGGLCVLASLLCLIPIVREAMTHRRRLTVTKAS